MSCTGGLASMPLARRTTRTSGAASRRKKERTALGHLGAHRGIQVALHDRVEDARRGHRAPPLAPARVDQGTGDRAVGAQEADQPAEVAQDVGRDAVAGRGPAQLAEHPGRGLDGGEREGVGALGRDHGVQHQAVHLRRVELGVGEGDLGSVGDRVERDAVHPQRLADRLDVLRGVDASCRSRGRRRAPGRSARSRGDRRRRGARARGSAARPSGRFPAGRRSPGGGRAARAPAPGPRPRRGGRPTGPGRPPAG